MERAGAETVIRNNHANEALRNNPPLPQDFLPQDETSSPKNRQARRYETAKLVAGLGQTLIFFVLTIVIVATGFTSTVESWVRFWITNEYAVLLGFAFLIGTAESVLAFPLKFYAGFYLEHRYNLSTQSFWSWVWDGMKGLMIGLVIGGPVLLALFYCLRTFGTLWWLPVGFFLFFLSVILARLAPVLIFPLFYTFKPVEGELNERIMGLCRQVGVKVAGIFTFDMSRNTRKANAAFTGVGKSKRIVLGDTLVAKFANDEIEAVFAHELGHYTMNHVWIMMGVGTISTFVGLFLTSFAYEQSIGWFHYPGIDSIAALPLLGLWLGVYSLITSPLSNMLSRVHEYAADRYAVRITGSGEPLKKALSKLADTNLADVAPNPVVEFLFHSHPSIERRLRAIGASQ